MNAFALRRESNESLQEMVARLCEAELPHPQAEHLPVLLDCVLEREPAGEKHREDLAFLTFLVLDANMPGATVDKAEAVDARNRCRRFRRSAREALGLEV